MSRRTGLCWSYLVLSRGTGGLLDLQPHHVCSLLPDTPVVSRPVSQLINLYSLTHSECLSTNVQCLYVSFCDKSGSVQDCCTEHAQNDGIVVVFF